MQQNTTKDEHFDNARMEHIYPNAKKELDFS